ncbi:hypothetical protein RY831_15185 [Noviherbaspirillum sp. CPCC 100848]|uniref:Uncharacterized protein n=1 Tax=Noviherbaspirillum album TaxID=3080276 RepID=A0ABU6JB13_9BURK|nr:hypothetical protein [Noviherbaspirillum sp. CPCC 100848]MEC4720505.1 hypothetical protein [Noviherbaspirillum sp. CPCC 100848]
MHGDQQLANALRLERAVIPTSQTIRSSSGSASAPAQFTKTAECTRNPSHSLFFYFVVSDDVLCKAGQFPSYATLAQGETKSFRKVLGDERVTELNTAIGLAAHGVGVGAFVYLRRIFESLVEDAHQAAKNGPKWDEPAYLGLRMAERLPLLAGHLPPFLVEHAKLYAILSLHLHELSDADCRASFDIVKQGLFAIAEDRLAERQRQQRAAAASKAIAGYKPPSP